MPAFTHLRQYVIGFDGTSNSAEVEEKHTNIFKLKKLFRPLDEPPFYYLAGVGTRTNELVSGNAWGAGITTRLMEVYRWLADQLNFPGRELDTYGIYIFGFSRGAYMARMFSWLVSRCGIPANSAECDELAEEFIQCAAHPEKTLNFEQFMAQWRASHAGGFSTPEIKLLGVFDTVKTADFGNSASIMDHELAPCVKVAYHAMALDEVRSPFPLTRFSADERVHEVWFAGSHSDIGGGYAEDGLSAITLQWMLDNAIESGLHFKNNPPEQNPFGIVHDESDSPLWKAFPKAPRIVEENDNMHVSVQKKIEAGNYTPLAKLPEKVNFLDY